MVYSHTMGMRSFRENARAAESPEGLSASYFSSYSSSSDLKAERNVSSSGSAFRSHSATLRIG